MSGHDGDPQNSGRIAPQNIYDDPRFFAGYARLRAAGTGLNEVLEQPALRSLLPERLDGLRVLDLGCGFGGFAREARAMGAREVLGLDVSANMLARARELTDDGAIRYVRAGVEDMDAALGPEDVFDLAVSSLALHYVADYPAAVAGVTRRLAPGGLFVFSVEHPVCTALASQQWQRDAEGRALCWPVDHYREEGPRRTRWFVDGVIKYHRTVETYVNALLDAGLELRRLLEPEPVADAEAARRVPNLDLHRRRPPFLLLSARKPEA